MSRKRNKNKIVNEKTVLVTADIGMNNHFIYIQQLHGADLKVFSIKNSRTGFDFLWTRISAFKEKHNLESIVFGFEPTGPYAEPLAYYLKAKKIKLVQVNPAHTKKYKTIVGNSPDKRDPKDPLIIGDLIKMGRGLSVILPEGPDADLRRLSQARESIVEQRNALYNKIHARLAIAFPEFQRILDTKTKSATWILQNYPSPEKVISLGYEKLEENLRKISRGQLKTSKIKALFEAAQVSVATGPGNDYQFMEIDFYLQQINQIDVFLKNVEKEMENTLPKIPYAKNLLSVKGLGIVSVSGLIGEVGGFQNYKSDEQLIKVAGLGLYEISSGRHKGQRHITKTGRSALRKILHMAVLGMISENGIYHNEYKKYIENKKPSLVAMVNICKKLLRLTFALAKSGVDYNSDYKVVKTAA